jgi:hypothetical protein
MAGFCSKRWPLDGPRGSQPFKMPVRIHAVWHPGKAISTSSGRTSSSVATDQSATSNGGTALFLR